MVKQESKEIKHDNSTNINEQNIAEIINLKEFSKTMIDNWHNRQKNNLVGTNISINMTDIKNSKKDSLIETIDERNKVKTLKTTLTDSKEDSHTVQKKSGMIEVEKKSSVVKF